MAEASPIILFGGGGHAKVVADILELSGKEIFKVVALHPDQSDLRQKYRVISESQFLEEPTEAFRAVIAIGEGKNRLALVDRLSQKKANVIFISTIHPSAVLANGVEVGAGSMMMAGSIVNPGTKIGSHCIINTGATIDHDCRIENFSSIAPGCSLGGGVWVSEGCTIGIGAKILPGKKIGRGSVVGAGAVVTRDIPDGVVAYGIPAKKIRQLESE